MIKSIIGYGGFAREVYWSIYDTEGVKSVFFVDDEWYNPYEDNVLPLSIFEPEKYEVVVCIGDSYSRKKVVDRLPENTKYFTHIHRSVKILGNDVKIGTGSVICAGCILTTNIELGAHTHLNLQTTVGHDTNTGSYFTTAPGVNISGNVSVGDLVYIGSNASIKQKIKICDNVTIGMNSCVVKNIEESGVYIGTPSYKIK
jgi:sugar O-acyltransferase (sialic acid O-acetyltransferase NeuD family)